MCKQELLLPLYSSHLQYHFITFRFHIRHASSLRAQAL